jgi:hypothetical protein
VVQVPLTAAEGRSEGNRALHPIRAAKPAPAVERGRSAVGVADRTTASLLQGEVVTNNPTVCVPDPERLVPFHELMAYNPVPRCAGAPIRPPRLPTTGAWNVSTRAVAYSCGHLTRDDRPLTHRHDPAELTRCVRLAEEVAQAARHVLRGRGRRLGPFFAAAVAGEPVAAEVTEELVRRAFGGTLFPDIQFSVTRLVPYPPRPRGDAARCAGGGSTRSAHVRLDHLPDPNGDIDANSSPPGMHSPTGLRRFRVGARTPAWASGSATPTPGRSSRGCCSR